MAHDTNCTMKRTKFLVAALAMPFMTYAGGDGPGDDKTTKEETTAKSQVEVVVESPEDAEATTEETATADVVVGTGIGQQAPELKFKGPDGKELALSDLRGQYVLIDFWASWCGPCRRENPNVVSAYRKYNKAKFKDGKGFEIYGVSLDNNHDRWVNAIKQDGLAWKYNVSDLKGWNSAGAALYGVRSIPSNFLIDPNGIIVAKNLRGQMLHMELDKYVKSFKK